LRKILQKIDHVIGFQEKRYFSPKLEQNRLKSPQIAPNRLKIDHNIGVQEKRHFFAET
jgi:hypothetical protein